MYVFARPAAAVKQAFRRRRREHCCEGTCSHCRPLFASSLFARDSPFKTSSRRAMSQVDDPIDPIEEISLSLQTLVDIWYHVLGDTHLLIQTLVRRLEERQMASESTDTTVKTAAGVTTRSHSRQQETTAFSYRPTPAPESLRHESASSVSSRTSMRGIEDLQQLLDQDAASVNSSDRRSQRTTRSHAMSEQEQRAFVAGNTGSPQSPQAVDRRESGSAGTEEVQVVVVEETFDDTAISPPGVRTRRRDVKAKTVVRDNISKLEAAIKRLEMIKSRMCTEIVCKTKGTPSYDAAAVEINDTVKKLQSVGIAD